MRTPQKSRGAVVVEFALLLPLLILFAFGITEYGRAMYQYDTLTKSARDAVRLLTQYAPGDATRIGMAKCLALHANRSCSGPLLLPGLTASMVVVSEQSNQASGAGGVDLVTVTIHGYPFISVVPGVVSNLTFGDISVTMRQTL